MRIVTTIQEGHPAQNIQVELTQELLRVAKDVFGSGAANTGVAWRTIPKGFAWTGGAPSNSSVVLFEVPEGTSQPQREAVMFAVHDLWMSRTDSRPEELLVATVDPHNWE